MQLRSDPAASAALAGAFTRNNAEQLRGAIGRPPSDGELYIAHFLGPYGAGKLIGAAMEQPQTNAVTMFPQAAAANRSIFFDRSGRQRSVADVYANLTGRFEVARAVRFAPNQRMADRTHPVPPELVPMPAARIVQSALPPPTPATHNASRCVVSADPVTRYCGRHASFCGGPGARATTAQQRAAVPDHVYRPHAASNANRDQSVDAGHE